MTPQLLQALRLWCTALPGTLALQMADVLCHAPHWANADTLTEVCRLPLQSMTAENREQFQRILLLCHGISPQELAGAVRGLVHAHRCFHQEYATSLVWTGPEQDSPIRRTEQVVFDLVQTARQRILLVTFAAYKMDALTQALNAAIERGVQVRLVLESQQDSEQQLLHDARNAFQGLGDAEIYYWPLENRPRNAAGRPAKLHAKCAASESSVFVSSANFTEDAFARNIEVGILQKNVLMAEEMWTHFEGMVQEGILRTVDGIH